MRSTLLFALFVALTAGCSSGSGQTARAPLTERQRDSVLAQSKIPGAFGVGRALAVSDREGARAKKMDAAVDSLLH